MSEPEIIHSNSPHEIVMPPGVHNAMGKSAHEGEPSIHRNLAKIDAHAVAPPSPAENITAVDTAPQKLKVITIAAHDAAEPAAPAEDQHADTPAPLVAQYDLAAAALLKSQISVEIASRLAALKLENDHILHRLDTLETLMGKPT